MAIMHHPVGGKLGGCPPFAAAWSGDQMPGLTVCILLLLAWTSSLARELSSPLEQSSLLLAGRGQQPRLKASAVAELVLPFTAGLLLALLDAASKHPAVAAVALCSLALAQPCLINTGDHALKHCYVVWHQAFTIWMFPCKLLCTSALPLWSTAPLVLTTLSPHCSPWSMMLAAVACCLSTSPMVLMDTLPPVLPINSHSSFCLQFAWWQGCGPCWLPKDLVWLP